eukprot:159870_1
MTARSTWSHFIDKPNLEDYEEEKISLETHPMTNRFEIWCWYLVDMATTPIGMILGSMIIPLYASTLSTQYGCIHHAPYQCDYYNKPINSNNPVMVPFAGSYWKPESFASLMVAISGGMQCVAYFFIASIADYSNYQHYLYRISIICTCIMVLMCSIFNKNDYYIALGIWTALLLVPFGLSNIFYNSYLPVLVENHWTIRRLKKNQSKYYEKEIRSIQDNLSQFGQAIGYFGGLIVTIIAAVLLFILTDITKELIEKQYGITTSILYNDFTVNIVSETDELWSKPVIGINVWYTNIFNISYINGMQFVYSDVNINGSIHGVNDVNDAIIQLYKINATDIIYNSVHFQLNQNDYVNQIELFMDTQYMIHAITFTTKYNDIFVVGNTHNLNHIETIKSIKYPDYTLSGYSTISAIYNDSILCMNIISGFNGFVFQDYIKGQYGENYDVMAVFIFCGLWLLVLTIPSFCTLKKRRKQSIPQTKSIFTVSAIDYCKSIKSATKLPHLFRTLIAWFVWSDAENTIGTIGILFAQNELHMTSVQLILLLIEIQFLAMFGNIFFTFISNKFHVNAKKLLIFHLSINALLPIWTIMGLYKSIGIGLVNVWEIYVMVGLLYATQLGSMFSTSRSLYGHLIPIGDESKFFGLYELTNKGSSWIGPLISALIANVANLRWALIYVLLFYLIAIPLLQFGVDYDLGMQQAGKQLDYQYENKDKPKKVDHKNMVNVEMETVESDNEEP